MIFISNSTFLICLVHLKPTEEEAWEKPSKSTFRYFSVNRKKANQRFFSKSLSCIPLFVGVYLCEPYLGFDQGGN